MKSLALFVIGHSPAIVTETLAALSMRDESVNGVRIVATQIGAKLLVRRLFEKGAWQAFCCAWFGMAQVHLDEASILFSNGLDDIRCETDNRRMAEMILAETQRAVDDSGAMGILKKLDDLNVNSNQHVSGIKFSSVEAHAMIDIDLAVL